MVIQNYLALGHPSESCPKYQTVIYKHKVRVLVTEPQWLIHQCNKALMDRKEKKRPNTCISSHTADSYIFANLKFMSLACMTFMVWSFKFVNVMCGLLLRKYMFVSFGNPLIVEGRRKREIKGLQK